MSAQVFLDQLRYAARSLPPTDTLRQVLDELLTMVGTGVVSFGQPSAAANTVGLFRDAPPNGNGAQDGHPVAPAKVLWGAHVNFKPHDVPSFVHELTHARCVLCYDADMVNYAPGGLNGAARTFGNGPPPGAPQGTVALVADSQIARRRGWYRDHCKTFLDTNLRFLADWADVTDFTAAVGFMDKKTKAEVKRLTANPGDVAGMNRLQKLQFESPLYGQVMKSRKFFGAAEINRRRLEDEKARKRGWIKERVNYGINGMGGLGDTHFEYDTVVNQMLYQMYLWGFRKFPAPTFTLVELQQHVQDETVPAAYLYELVAALADEAHQRRVAAQGIADGAPPAIQAPAVAINPPT